MEAAPSNPNDMRSTTPEDSARRDQRDNRTRIAAIVLVALAVLLAWWLWMQTGIVPDVTGMTEQQARAALEQAGFEAGDIEVDLTGLAAPGTVDDQGIRAGTRAIKGDRIDLFIAQAPKDSEDPDIETPEVEDAGGFITDDDDGDSVRDRGDDQYATGIGTISYPGVPQVLNQTESSAVSELRGEGYSVRIVRAPNAGGIGRGRVFYQTPEPGAAVSSGVVEIWISTGVPSGGIYKRPNIP